MELADTKPADRSPWRGVLAGVSGLLLIAAVLLLPGTLADIPNVPCNGPDADARQAQIRDSHQTEMTLANVARALIAIAALMSLVGLVAGRGYRGLFLVALVVSLGLFGWYLWVDFHIQPLCLE